MPTVARSRAATCGSAMPAAFTSTTARSIAEGGQHGADLGRDKALARIEWERYGYTAKEIRVNAGQILRDAEDALGLPHDPGRVGAWLAEYERSSLAPVGWHTLARRLRRFDRTEAPRRSPSGAS
jgi:hypothetical protein